MRINSVLRLRGHLRKHTELKSVLILLALFAVSTATLSAQTFTSLYSFDSNTGANPGMGALIQGTDGNFYGTTINGGSKGFGAIYKITTTGAETTLYSFCELIACDDGKFPYGSLVEANDGNFYGTTNAGGTFGNGSIFKITPNGTFTSLYSFCTQEFCADGQHPMGGLLQGSDGNLYGTTVSNIFKITTGGSFTVLYTLCATQNCPDGAASQAALIQSTNGNYFGTEAEGGVTGCGTVFQVTAAGKFTTLHSFDETDGCFPGASLVQASNGNYYGTTPSGGVNNAGTIFKVTAAGVFTTLYNFCTQTNCADGGYSHATLIQATDGNFYGATAAGANANGVIFEFTSGNKMTTLHTFTGPDGDVPEAGVVQGTDGTFYGTTQVGGVDNYGTVYNLATGLGAFVRMETTAGKVGTAVIVIGSNLTGTTSVSFNGTPATFTVLSGSELTATVPSGATTGTLQVTIPPQH